MIAVNRMWLFQTGILDPFIFDTTDGVSVTMESERVIELLTLANAEFEFDNTVMGVLNWVTFFGGQDNGATVATGKSEVSYELSFDFPNYSPEMVDRLAGNEWAALIETAGRDRIVIFARLQADGGYEFENDQKGRMVLKSERTSSRPYRVANFTVSNVTYLIDRAFICSKVGNGNFIGIE